MKNDDITYIKQIKEYALNESVPIMMDEGINFLTSFIVKNRINSVLEIGSAIGYSAIMMALVNPNLKVVTVEKDEKRYLEAVKNIKKLKLEDRITIIFNDALEINVEETFELIFIDAAKGKNIDFFNKFERNLEDNGYIITDNINLHGFVDMPDYEIKSKNMRSLVRKIKEYIDFLKQNTDYNTEFIEIGDGITISKRNN